MASPVGNLVVRIGADLSGLRSGVEKAQGSLARLGSSMRTGINVAGKYAAAMAAAGVALTAALVHKAFDAIDAQAKLARQLRATNAGLATLTRAGDLAGVEQEKMTMAVRRLDVAIGESIRGTATYKDAFTALGLSAKQISEMDADKRVAAINEALRENVPAAQRAQVAGVLFGNRVGAAIAAIKPDELARARDEVESLGLAVSEVDSATIESLNDNMSTLREVFTGIVNRVAVKLAPIIALIAEKLKSAAMESRGFEDSITSAFEGALKVAGFFGDTVQGLRVVFKGVETVVYGFGAVVASVLEAAVKGIFAFASEVNKSVNFIIQGMNKIPKVDIPLLQTDISQFGAVKFVSDLGDAMRDKVGEVRGELHGLLMEELPSQKIEQFMAEVKAGADAVSAASVQASKELENLDVKATKALARLDPKNAAKMIDEASAQLDEQFSMEDETARYKEGLQSKLDALRDSMKTESELEMDRYEERFALLQESLENELVTEADYQKLREDMAAQHQDRLAQIEEAGLNERQKFERASLQQKAKIISGNLADITAGVAQHNRKMFELNKVAGIASAIINAYEGISKTLAAYPYPINIGMAAAHAAAAFAQVSAIKSASFGGGSAPSLAGSTPATPVTPVSSGAPSQIGGARLAVEGIDPNSLFSGRTVRELAERLKEHIADGGDVVFV